MTGIMHGWTKEVFEKPLKMRDNSNKENLKISVVIPTLNQAETIEETILSIIKQDYSNFEIIVMDGGSTDKTLKILESYEAWIKYMISQDDGGQSNAINNGFQLADGDIFAWINSDDYYWPGCFSKVVNLFNQRRDIDIVVGAGEIVSREGCFLKHINPMAMTRENLLQWENDKWIMQQSCFWSAKIWKESSGVDEDLDLLMDFDLWLRFAELGKSATLTDVLGVMRYYPEAKTVNLKTKMKEELGYVYAKNGALSEVKRIIHELVQINQAYAQILERRDKRLITRVLKKLRVEL